MRSPNLYSRVKRLEGDQGRPAATPIRVNLAGPLTDADAGQLLAEGVRYLLLGQGQRPAILERLRAQGITVKVIGGVDADSF